MSTQDQDAQLGNIELSIEQAQQMIDEADALTRLHKNKDFKMVITDAFFQDESKRAVLLRSDHEMQTPEKLAQVDNIITSIGGLFAFFNKVYTMGNMAKQSMAADQATRQEILEEQLDEETL